MSTLTTIAFNLSDTASNVDWNETLAQALAEQLHALHEFSARHRRQLDDAEAELANQVTQLIAEQVEERTKRALAEAPAGADPRKMADAEDRYRLCLEDLRDWKERCSELEEELNAARSAAVSAPLPTTSKGLSWEEQKQRLIAALESDMDGKDKRSREDRLTVEGAIRITDNIVQEKDREIMELRKLLAEQKPADTRGAAIESALEADELVRQERVRLKQMQDELNAKLRAAEIEISQERAKLARDLTEVEEHRRALEHANKQRGGSTEKPDAEAKPRSRWLTRLGLKDNET